MTDATDLTLYRGTTEAWEIAVMEAMPVGRRQHLSGTYGERMLKVDPKFDLKVNQRINRTYASQLRSGKEIVLGNKPKPFAELTAKDIEAELRARVGVETAAGTANFYSHFVPCGIEPGISTGFGKGGYYEFNIYGAIFDTVNDYWSERATFTGTPLFRGGKNEALAYTGTVIRSVRYCVPGGRGRGLVQSRVVLNSLD